MTAKINPLLIVVLLCVLSSLAVTQTLDEQLLPPPSISAISSYGLEEGLPVTCIEQVVTDNKGRLWINPCQAQHMENELDFFQYDGREFRFFEPPPLEQEGERDSMIWSVLGETAQGFLFGIDYGYSTVFWWHPDTRQHLLFPFTEEEQILNLIPEPEGGLLVLTFTKPGYRVYRLQEKGKQLLGEVRLDFEEFAGNAFYNNPLGIYYPIPSQLKHQKLWFFHQRTGLVSFDLQDGSSQLHRWSAIDPELELFHHPRYVWTSFLGWELLSYGKDHLLLFMGQSNGFYLLDLSSMQLRPHAPLNQALNSMPTWSFPIFFWTSDQKNNVLISMGYKAGVGSNENRPPFRAYLLDTSGQLYDYTPLIHEMSANTQYQYMPPTDGRFFSQDFQRQIGWASYGGLVLLELQPDYNLEAFSINVGARAIAPLDSIHLFVNTDEHPLALHLKEQTYRKVKNLNLHISTFSTLINRDDQELWMAHGKLLVNYDAGKETVDTFPVEVDFAKFAFLNASEMALFKEDKELFIYNLDTRTLHPYLHEGQPFQLNSTLNEMRYTLSEDLLWVAAQNGLWQIDLGKDRITHFNRSNGWPDDRIICIHQGEGSTLWLGTAQAGVLLFNYETGAWRQINRTQGLSDNTVVGILQDDHHNRWVATFNGITVISPDGKVLFELHEQDGLTHNEFNRTSYTKLPDGRMVFGGVEGVNILDPEKILQIYLENKAPIIYLNRLEYYNRKKKGNQVFKGAYNQSAPIPIPAANRYLTLDFAISDYINLPQHAYSYRIIPAQSADTESTPWTNLGPISELTLNNLPVGDWVVQVRGINHNGNQVEAPLEIPIHVSEFFYRSWWFYVLCALPFLFGGWLWIRRLNTERKRLQVEVEKRTEQIREDKEIIARQVVELQQFDEAKSRFFANISHELRTPLTIILGMNDQIAKEPERWVNDGTKMIRNNGSNLLDLVNQILELQKLESGNLKVNLQHNDILPFLQSIFEQFQAYASSKDLQLAFDSELDTLPMDYDPEKILRIVSNLLSNAVKYTPEKGKITFSVASGIKPGLEAGQCLILSIRDTGRGIPKEELPYIFDRFFQTSAHEKVTSSGTGIGLALTQELVRLLQGKIEVSSQLGEGSVFQVFLPITRRAAPGQVDDPVVVQSAVFGTQGPPKKEKVASPDLPIALIVEDNPDVSQYLEICLEDQYALEFAANGQEGIDMALEKIPDIIISDVMMPEKDGFELCEALKKDTRTSHVPIILLTAKSDVASRITGLKQGADDYLGKPFHEEELLVRMQNLLNIRNQLQERYKDLFEHPPTPSKAPAEVKEDAFILQLKEAFEERMDDPQFDLDALSKKLLLSRSQFGRKIKALTGQSPAVYLRSLRLQKARYLLLHAELSVKEIAYDVGFSSHAYFSKSYAEKYGETPTNTREND